MDCLQTSYEAVRNGTQAFADEDHLIWNDLERPLGLKNEALFPSQWSKYHTKEYKRGSINNHLSSWQGGIAQLVYMI